MTKFIIEQALKYMKLIITSDSFMRVFTVDERNHINRAYEAIESASHYPE